MTKTTISRLLVDARNHHQNGDLQNAEELYRQVIELDPRNHDAWHLLGALAQQVGQNEIAIEFITLALSFNPKNGIAHCNLANALRAEGDIDGAVRSYRKALKYCPDDAITHNNLALALQQQGDLDAAIKSFEKAVRYKADFAEAYSNLGKALTRKGKHEQAFAAYQKALNMQPGAYGTLIELGNTLMAQDKFEEAIVMFRRASEEAPNDAIPLSCLGRALVMKWMPLEASTYLFRAIEIDPNSAPAYANLGFALTLLGKPKQAVYCFRKALEIKPDYAEAHSNMLFISLYRQDMTAEQLFHEHIRFGQMHSDPLKESIQPHSNSRNPGKRLRIGYVSGDFRKHPVAAFVEPFLAQHDRSEVEVFCYSNYQREDSVTERLRRHANHWRDIATLSDDEAAKLIRNDQIDILVDLSGHTAANRLLLFARKPAPVQVTMLGYPQTTGMSAMDYRITNEVVDPTGVTDEFNVETLVRLPAGPPAFLPPVDSPEVNALPALSNGHFTFASFNNLAKASAATIAAWADVLHSVPGSRMIIVGSANELLESAFRSRGISMDRLEMIGRRPMREYLELHHKVDLLLDTFPYNGSTTNRYAVWMGVPCVTLSGDTATARAGACVLSAVGLQELVAYSPEEYVSKAVQMASELPRLARWREELRSRVLETIANPVRFTNDLEKAYREMWQKWCAMPAEATAELVAA